MAKTRSQTKASASIVKLSPEILRLIFRYFCSHCCGDYQWPFGPKPGHQPAQDNNTLFNLCLVSQYFRNTAQEILYHSFDPGNQEVDLCRGRVESFLETVAARSDLARSVKAVFIQVNLIAALDFGESSRVFDLCARSLGTSAREIYQKDQALEESRRSDYQRARRAFLLGEPLPRYVSERHCMSTMASELLAILVSVLPSLVHLGVAEDYTRWHRWQFGASGQTLDALGIRSLPLKTLESDSSQYQLTTRSPELETLVTLGKGWGFTDMPSVRNLHLRSKAAMRSGEISDCLKACNGTLSTFSYTAVDNGISYVIQCLDQERLHQSLESLHLDLDHIPHEPEEQIPTLKEFTKLKTLFLRASDIYKTNLGAYSGRFNNESFVEILPPNITSLTLVAFPKGRQPNDLKADLLRLLDVKSTLFRQLKLIQTDSYEVFGDELMVFSRLVGVELIHQELQRNCRSCTGQIRLTGNVDRYNSSIVLGQPLPHDMSDWDSDL
ncbi:hypothetical protein F53441_13255 [Fusarium austroafricanum]|uniref:F-box domain-containing protein n=1 Tax=Fusarium austroafricanum TaxID=2364996 RepID=A0A8H4JPB0_9HYPO|nr:hypothetical protein F53441_13255 [Fusarium austroafricanum]